MIVLIVNLKIKNNLKNFQKDLDHQRWKHRRGLFNPGFHRKFVNIFHNIQIKLTTNY